MTLTRNQRIITATIGTLLIGSASGLITADAIATWYVGLNKPSFNPPNWLFGPAWTVLYLLMGVAAGLVWSSPVDQQPKRRALFAYLIQLALNVLWTVIFFGLHSPTGALVEIVVLWLAIVCCMRQFLLVHRTAGLLLVPYLLWVTFASILNGAILALN